MANNNVENISTGKPQVTGAAFVAPLGSVLPNDAVTQLAPEFVNVGYCAESGLTNSISNETNDVKAWGGDTVLTIQTGRSETYALSLLEMNQTALKQVFGEGNVTVSSDSIVVIGNNAVRERYVWVFEILLSAGRIMRIVIPSGKVTEVGDISFVDGEPIKFDLTIAALPDAIGNTSYRYIAKVE